MVEGNKRSFGDLDDEEEDIFSSKKVTLSTSSCANFFFLFVQNDFVVFFYVVLSVLLWGHQTVLARSLLYVYQFFCRSTLRSLSWCVARF